jgi:hypothetical protein
MGLQCFISVFTGATTSLCPYIELYESSPNHHILFFKSFLGLPNTNTDYYNYFAFVVITSARAVDIYYNTGPTLMFYRAMGLPKSYSHSQIKVMNSKNARYF